MRHVAPVPPTRRPRPPRAGPARPPRLRLPVGPRARCARHVHARAVPRGGRDPVPGHGLLLGRGEAPVAAARSPHDGRRLPGRVHAAPHVQRGLHRHDRARRDGDGRLRPHSGGHDRRAARLLGEPRPHPGDAPGQRCRQPVPQRGLLEHARAAVAGREQRGRLRRGPARRGVRPDHHRARDRPSRTGRSSCRSTTPRPTTSSTCTRTRTGTTATPTPASCCRRSNDPGGLPPLSGLGQRGDGGGGRGEPGGPRGPGSGGQARHRTAARGAALPGRPLRTVHGYVHPSGRAR